MKSVFLPIGLALGLLCPALLAQDNNGGGNASSGTAPASDQPAPRPRVIPKKFGDCTGPVYIGHRTVTKRYTEWGWIWKEKETYRKGRWTIIKENPGVAMIPGRFINNINGDDNIEYKLYGEFAPYRGYDPNYDLFVDVFIIKGFELIGKANPVDIKPPLPSNKRRSSISSRSRGLDIDF
jgi:hypothetical protein